MLARSPTMTFLAAGRAARASWALAALRACSVTECPSAASNLAAISPRPSVEPVMSTRDISNSLQAEAHTPDWHRQHRVKMIDGQASGSLRAGSPGTTSTASAELYRGVAFRLWDSYGDRRRSARLW